MHHTRRTEAPARRAVTLADALAQVREFEGDNGAGDLLLEAYIAAAHDACEQRTERALITSDWLLTLDAFPAACRFNPHAAIALRACPVQSVLSIKYDDADGVEQTLDPAAYRVSLTQEPALITPVDRWPATLSAPGAVRVAYRAGYGDAPADVPAPLKQWILLAVGDLYERRNASAEQPATPHQFVDALLQPYRLLGV
jgi:uncharacterized phiE125 gp8 family phage protein